jgi:hypothetical protein
MGHWVLGIGPKVRRVIITLGDGGMGKAELGKSNAGCGQARLNSEPQNNEYRTAEFRRVDSLCSVFFKLTEYIPSTFDIHDSIFAFDKCHKEGIFLKPNH